MASSSSSVDDFDGVVVVGGGLVGCLSAIMAARETGLAVRLYEGRPDWRMRARDEFVDGAARRAADYVRSTGAGEGDRRHSRVLVFSIKLWKT